jgi:hypothetical protein
LFVKTLPSGHFQQKPPVFTPDSGLRAVIPRAVLCIGSEDHEDLIADATLLAARNMHNAEAKGKTITASSAAFYAVGT